MLISAAGEVCRRALLGQYCREVEIEVEIEPIEREARMRIYTQVSAIWVTHLRVQPTVNFYGKCVTPESVTPHKTAFPPERKHNKAG